MVDNKQSKSGEGKQPSVSKGQREFTGCKHFGAAYDTHIACAICREKFG